MAMTTSNSMSVKPLSRCVSKPPVISLTNGPAANAGLKGATLARSAVTSAGESRSHGCVHDQWVGGRVRAKVKRSEDR